MNGGVFRSAQVQIVSVAKPHTEDLHFSPCFLSKAAASRSHLNVAPNCFFEWQGLTTDDNVYFWFSNNSRRCISRILRSGHQRRQIAALSLLSCRSHVNVLYEPQQVTTDIK